MIDKTNVHKVYSIVVSTECGSVLHMGIHNSLDSAFLSASRELKIASPCEHKAIADIDYWSTMEIHDILNILGIQEVEGIKPVAIVPKPVVVLKTVKEVIKEAKIQKNVIMKAILANKDLNLLKDAKPLLSKAEVRFLESKLIINN